jgi:hypothetical protein
MLWSTLIPQYGVAPEGTYIFLYFCFYFALTSFGLSAQCQLNKCPLCSTAIALNRIAPMARKIRKKTTAMMRTGIPHLCAHSGTALACCAVIAVTVRCEPVPATDGWGHFPRKGSWITTGKS